MSILTNPLTKISYKKTRNLHEEKFKKLVLTHLYCSPLNKVQVTLSVMLNFYTRKFCKKHNLTN